MESVFDVAQFIIEHEKRSKRPLSTMRLQKLLYYCQVYSLILRERKLFDADFHAWRKGAVAPVIEEHHRGSYLVPKNFPGNPNVQSDSQVVILKVLGDLGDLSADAVSDRCHEELPWAVAWEEAEALGVVVPGSWRTEREVNMSENVMRGYKKGNNSVIPIPPPPGIKALDYNKILQRLADRSTMEDYVQEFAEDNTALLAYIVKNVPFEDYSKVRMVEALANHWDEDPENIRPALIDALEDGTPIVQDRAFRGLLSFYYSGDQTVVNILNKRETHEYHQAVRGTVQGLLKHV